jgi:hypothetical protein
MGSKVPTSPPAAPKRALQGNDRVPLGSKVTDKITGLTGRVVGIVEYISGCNQVLVSPPVDKDGKYVDAHWVDVQRLEILDEPRVTLDNGTTPGCDMPAPVK